MVQWFNVLVPNKTCHALVFAINARGDMTKCVEKVYRLTTIKGKQEFVNDISEMLVY
jgi:hypothetical protein